MSRIRVSQCLRLSASQIAVCLLTATTLSAQAAVTRYTSLAGFNAAVGGVAACSPALPGGPECFETTAENILKANEVTTLPNPDTGVGSPTTSSEGPSLTFASANTGLFYSFQFTSLQPIRGLTFDDDEGGPNLPNFDNALSPGDIVNGRNDDWRIRLIDPPVPLRGFGFQLRDSDSTTGEFLRLYDAGGALVHEVEIGTVDTNSFFGVVSDEPFVEIRFDEDSDGDDIAVADFRFFAEPPPVAPTALDVFVATPFNPSGDPQPVDVRLEGSDEANAALTYSVITGVSSGTLRDTSNNDAVVITGDLAGPTLSYTPNSDFTGTAVFTYRVSDGNENSSIRIVTIEVFESYRQEALQIGDDIIGEGSGDQSGSSVAISGDGQTLAIGAPLNDGIGQNAGHVRVYVREGTDWVQRGADIDGEAAFDQAGFSVELSSDGQTVAVGAQLNDGSSSNAGHVRVYSWNGSNWAQRGQDIDGEAAGDQSATSLALSSNGQTLAIAAVGNDGNEVSSGHVRVYVWNGATWVQRGDDIDGEVTQDRSGHAVALSSDGEIVAIGARFNNGSGNNAGHVRVYQWGGNSWIQRGQDIDGEAAGDYAGSSVALSSDGQTLAVGAELNDGNGVDSGHVRVFTWSGATWEQQGGDIDGEAPDDQSGSAVSISDDGRTVAIGAVDNDSNGNDSGHVRVYRWDGLDWLQLGVDIDGQIPNDEFGTSLALSGDGQTLAIGAPFDDGLIPNSGSDDGDVRVFKLTLAAGEDDDRDGIANADDQCPGTTANEITTADTTGCAPGQIDTDGDGVGDIFDAFPNDPTETTDTDGDGLGDNREGQLGTDPNSADSDNDGFSDLDEVEAESDPLSADDVPSNSGLNIILIKAAIDAKG